MKQILPALTVVGGACSLVAGPALSLELGELTIESKLGQPLRASIAYVLQPHEQLHDYCISLKPGPTDSGLPALSRAAIALGDDAIRLTGTIPVREPMLGLQVSVNCPYTPNLQREYAMFFDPLSVTDEAVTEEAPPIEEPAAASAATEARTAARSPTQRTATTVARPAQPIAAASRHLVQPGETLSEIVARISDRPPGLWPAVYAVFNANPQAFIDGDINLIKAGSWLTIPDLHAALGRDAASPAVRDTNRAETPAATPAAESFAAYDGPSAQATVRQNRFDSGFTSEAATVKTAPSASAETAAIAPAPDTTIQVENYDLRAGDIVLGDDSPFVSADVDPAQPQQPIVTPDRTISPRLAVRDAGGVQNRSWSLLAWLGGAGVAVFLGLLLFGRQLREKFGSTPIARAPARTPERRRPEPEPVAAAPAAVDFDFDGDSGDHPTMSLDADLGLGTGLRRSTDIDVAQDFGFSARHDFAQEVDLEFPEGADYEPDQPTTDIIPPHRMAEPSILESEIPPSDDDDEYDLSMIVDATREPIVDTHLTAKDLKAVPVGMSDEDDESGEYTLSREVDYKILEQDYQEEFTTTQALNAEIARAAMELAHSMAGKGQRDDTAELPRNRRAMDSRDDRTAEMPGRTGLEITAELAGNVDAGDAVNDDLIGDLDDTGVNEELTAELLQDDHDVTAEMAVEGGRVNTKQKRVS
ncbi:MAG TPA: hypothetical protein VLB07_07605 [Woeseiaceae bacterium]|nr:hypothetical protein [Woeseiaceae bacterium]